MAGQQPEVWIGLVQPAHHVAHVVAGQVGPLGRYRVCIGQRLGGLSLPLHAVGAVAPRAEVFGRSFCLLVLLAHALLGAAQHRLAEADSALGGSHDALASEVAGHAS